MVLQDGNNLESSWTSIKLNQCPLGILFIRPSSWGMCWEYFIWKPVSHQSSRLEQGVGEMCLSAAVSLRCTVWKSSVMAYLMVIVQSGESPPSCLHAGIWGAQSAGNRSGRRVGRCGGSVVTTDTRWYLYNRFYEFAFLLDVIRCIKI